MNDNGTNAIQVRKLLRQQAAIAHFGSFALRESDVLKVLTEAARVCAECLSVPFSKVCHYRERENDLLIEAGYGWHAGVVGNVVSRADETSPQGRAFITGKPSICNDLRDDNDFELPPSMPTTASSRPSTSSSRAATSSPTACLRSIMTNNMITISTTSIF